jgi:hypothetical protein
MRSKTFFIFAFSAPLSDPPKYSKSHPQVRPFYTQNSQNLISKHNISGKRQTSMSSSTFSKKASPKKIVFEV